MAGPTKVRKQLIDSFLQEWLPSWGANGAMTVSNISHTYKKYSIENNILELQLIADLDLGGTASNEITFTFPNSPIWLQPIAAAEYSKLDATIKVGGSWIELNGLVRPSYGEIHKIDNSNFSLGSALKISIKGKYEIAIP
jgi:hypothetical protein